MRIGRCQVPGVSSQIMPGPSLSRIPPAHVSPAPIRHTIAPTSSQIEHISGFGGFTVTCPLDVGRFAKSTIHRQPEESIKFVKFVATQGVWKMASGYQFIGALRAQHPAKLTWVAALSCPVLSWSSLSCHFVTLVHFFSGVVSKAFSIFVHSPVIGATIYQGNYCRSQRYHPPTVTVNIRPLVKRSTHDAPIFLTSSERKTIFPQLLYPPSPIFLRKHLRICIHLWCI